MTSQQAETLQKSQTKPDTSSEDPDANTAVTDAAPSNQPVTLTGPEGNDYRLSLPTTAHQDEIAAITATVGALISSETETIEDTPPPQVGQDAWSRAARQSAVGMQSRPRTTPASNSGWSFAARSASVF